MKAKTDTQLFDAYIRIRRKRQITRRAWEHEK